MGIANLKPNGKNTLERIKKMSILKALFWRANDWVSAQSIFVQIAISFACTFVVLAIILAVA